MTHIAAHDDDASLGEHGRSAQQRIQQVRNP